MKSAATALTVWFIPGEVLPMKLESPLYCAVMGCVPAESVDVVSVAFPLLRPAVPILEPLSRNVTLPVGVPVVLELTVAASVTDCPWLIVGELEDTFVVVPALLTGYVHRSVHSVHRLFQSVNEQMDLRDWHQSRCATGMSCGL